MNKTSKVIGAALGGVFGGLALSLILCAATSVIAISMDSPATAFRAPPGTQRQPAPARAALTSLRPAQRWTSVAREHIARALQSGRQYR
jgi:hypothetical protein